MRSARPRGSVPVLGVSRWWNQIVGSGVEGTRHHGRPSPSSHHLDGSHDVDLDAPDPAPRRAPTSAPQEVETAAEEAWDDEWIVESDPTPSPGVDPLLARLGGLAIVTTLLVPLVLGLGSHDDTPAADSTQAPVTFAVAPTDPNVSAAPLATTATATPDSPPAPSIADSSTSDSSTSGSTSEVSTGSAPTAALTVTSDTTPTAAADNSTDQASAELSTGAVASEGADREQRCAIGYDVVEGDFWIRLADASGVSLGELLDANDATVDTPLYPGTTICLPDGASAPAAPTTASPATTSPAATTPAATAKPVTSTAPSTTIKPVVTYPTISAAAAEQIIRDVWPDDLEDRAIEIAARESNLVVTAKNSCCYGLFQLNWNPHKAWLAGLGVTSPDQLFDATTNAYAAYALYLRSGGWGPWT